MVGLGWSVWIIWVARVDWLGGWHVLIGLWCGLVELRVWVCVGWLVGCVVWLGWVRWLVGLARVCGLNVWVECVGWVVWLGGLVGLVGCVDWLGGVCGLVGWRVG